MLERYTERARHTVHFARLEAMQSRSASIDGGHLLLALLRLRGPGAQIGKIFDRRRLTLDQVRNEIERRPDQESGSPDVLLDEDAFSEHARQILEFAAEEASRMGDAAVDSEHLLLGILGAEGSAAATFLKAHGFRLDDIREEIVAIRSQPPMPPGVYVTAAKTGAGGAETGSDDGLELEAFDLRAVLSRVCGSELLPFPPARIELPPSLDPDARYDFLLVLEPGGDQRDRHELMRRGLEAHFHVRIDREDRPTDVYVLAAAEPGRSTMNDPISSGDGGFISSSCMQFSLPEDASGEPPTLESLLARFTSPDSIRRAMRTASIGPISVSNGTLAEFCHALEQALDRPVVDETGLDGRHDIELPDGPGDLAERVRNELGFALTPERRSVPWIVVRENA